MQGRTTDFVPSRHRALQRLAAFVPYAGRTYAAKRNFDLGESEHRFVSGLSPDIRHRVITEYEVVAAVLRSHSAAVAEKFIQEVCWRTYWKGWLEQSPQVWTDYLNDVANARAGIGTDFGIASEVAAAERGDVGIACFDAWAKELTDTGYMHNHARMWFASIWIFTLKLPWQLGADFFYRHLLDGDAASNTLSWRWVAGLQTRGKIYLARADNIATFTEGRFNPGREELAQSASPLNDDRIYMRQPRRPSDPIPDRARVVLLVTEDDLSPETWALGNAEVSGVALFKPANFAPAPSPVVRALKIGLLADARARCAAHWQKPVAAVATIDELVAFAAMQNAAAIVTTHVPVGYTQAALARWIEGGRMGELAILQIHRRWDELFWPHANTSFSKLKERIPAVLEDLQMPTNGPPA